MKLCLGGGVLTLKWHSNSLDVRQIVCLPLNSLPAVTGIFIYPCDDLSLFVYPVEEVTKDCQADRI